MGQFKKFRSTAVSLLGAGMLVLAGCGGGGGGGGSGLSIPAGAVTLTEANAESMARAGFAQVDMATATSGFAFKSGETPSIQGAINLALDQIFADRLAARSIATGVTETIPCDFGSITFTGDSGATSASGSMSFNSCDLGGIVVNGSFSFSATFNNAGDYTVNADGTLSFAFDTEQFTIAMDMNGSGNDFSGDFSQSINFSISGITGGGFLFTTVVPMTGNEFALTITGGQFIISGAGGTRIRVTVVGTNLIDIELDDGSGTFQPHSSGVYIGPIT